MKNFYTDDTYVTNFVEHKGKKRRYAEDAVYEETTKKRPKKDKKQDFSAQRKQKRGEEL